MVIALAATSFTRSLFTTPSPKYDDFLVGNAAYNPSSFESIATVTATGSSTTTLSLTSIPSTYKSLQVRFNYASVSNAGATVGITYNGVTSSSYVYHYLTGAQGSVQPGAQSATTSFSPQGALNAVRTTYPHVGILDIIDYASTSKNKTSRVFFGRDENTTNTGEVSLVSNLFLSTSAISSITFTIDSDAFAAGSTIALYGIN